MKVWLAILPCVAACSGATFTTTDANKSDAGELPDAADGATETASGDAADATAVCDDRTGTRFSCGTGMVEPTEITAPYDACSQSARTGHGTGWVMPASCSACATYTCACAMAYLPTEPAFMAACPNPTSCAVVNSGIVITCN